MAKKNYICNDRLINISYKGEIKSIADAYG